MDMDPGGEMQLGTGRGSRGKVAVVVLVLIAGGAGFAAWQMYGQARQAGMQRDRAIAEQRANAEQVDRGKKAESRLAECTTGLDAEKATRGQTEKLASDTAANLDATRAELEELRKEHADNEKTVAAFKAIGDKLRKMIDAGKIQLTIRSGRMIVKLPAEVLFPSGSADLSKDGQTHLGEVAGALRQFPDRKFMISGHTDNIPVGDKRFKDNWELSTGRALTVLQFLVSKGMRPNRLVAAGHGEFEPLYTNSTEAGRRENRRIEIVLMPSTAELPKIPPPAPAASAKAK
jgi:chemotaxis protein MotB